MNHFDVGAGVQVLKTVTTHIVSCDDWVSRTSLVDEGVAIAVRGGDHALWLVSTTEVLAPDPARLRERAALLGGPSADRAKVTLVKVTVAWPSDDVGATRPTPVDVTMPEVLVTHGAGVAAIAIDPSSSLADHLAGQGQPHAIDIDRLWPVSRVAPESRLFVQSLFTEEDGRVWSTTRTTTLASRPSAGFGGRADLTALDLQLADDEQGCAVVVPDHPDVPCVGLTVRLRRGQGAMVPIDVVAEVINHKRSSPLISSHR
jgi:hypothetical protein